MFLGGASRIGPPYNWPLCPARPLRTMSSVHNPQKKKRLAYERDHYAKSKHDKARNAWRTKKHKARRSYRHSVDSLARAAALDDVSDSKIPGVRQQVVRSLPARARRSQARKACSQYWSEEIAAGAERRGHSRCAPSTP